MAYKCGRCGQLSGDREHWLPSELAEDKTVDSAFDPIIVTCKTCQMLLDVERENINFVIRGGLKDVDAESVIYIVCDCGREKTATRGWRWPVGHFHRAKLKRLIEKNSVIIERCTHCCSGKSQP